MDKLCYWEIPSTDIKASSAFFSGLFGWSMQESGENYMMFSVEDGMGGGIQQVEEEPAHAIAVYVGVDDIPDTLDKVQDLGGTVMTSKTEIGGGHGYWADFVAPGGARIGLWSQT